MPDRAPVTMPTFAHGHRCHQPAMICGSVVASFSALGIKACLADSLQSGLRQVQVPVGARLWTGSTGHPLAAYSSAALAMSPTGVRFRGRCCSSILVWSGTVQGGDAWCLMSMCSRNGVRVPHVVCSRNLGPQGDGFVLGGDDEGLLDPVDVPGQVRRIGLGVELL